MLRFFVSKNQAITCLAKINCGYKSGIFKIGLGFEKHFFPTLTRIYIQMKISHSLFLASFIFLILFACSPDEEPLFQEKYTTEDLYKLHGTDLKDWRIEAFYDNYKQKVLSAKNACFIDDIFVFQKGTNEIQVVPGEISCSDVDPEDEITTASYEFYEQEGLIFISISKASVVNGVIKNNFFSLQLVELSNSKMIFASGEKGDYGMSLVFVSI
ncbi:hypothetical protein ACPUEN_12715 [Algoriphagus yeomjeoni]|uniref:hypothetical protein n=1 Tax=Algoriphagus yeomjeoni TaxID=291403 RepID=UPI003CE50376